MPSMEKEDLGLIKQLLSQPASKHIGGWSLVPELIVPCLNVDRDEDIAENSKIYHGFKRDQPATVAVRAVIYVREKILIGLASVNG